jgi:PAS domain-containing protein
MQPDVAGLKSAGIIETLPVALIVCDEDGAVRSANAAARAIWRGDVPGSLDAMMDGDDARALLIRAGRAGVAGTTARLDTGWGKRAFRLLARHLDGAQRRRRVFPCAGRHHRPAGASADHAGRGGSGRRGQSGRTDCVVFRGIHPPAITGHQQQP